MKRRLLVGALLVALLVAAMAVPTLLFERWIDGARACLTSIETRTEPKLPRCDDGAASLALAKRMPWTRRAAERMTEELAVRLAVMRYLDAAIGTPNKQTLIERFEATRVAGRSVLSGSERLRLDELGDPLPIPEPGVLAQRAGHRRMLIDRGSRWIEHYTQLHTLEAALLEGELPRALELADHYAETPNGDMAVRVAALLCVAEQYERGMKLAADVEAPRAEKRTANFSTHFGAVRVVVEACAAGGGLKAPDVPSYGYAGSWDHRARILAMRIQSLRARDAGKLDDTTLWHRRPALRDNIAHVVERLRSGHPQRYRLELLSLVAESLTESSKAAALARPLEGEPTLEARMPSDLGVWLDRAADAPNLRAEQLEGAASHLLTLATDGSEDDATTLRTAAMAMLLHAALAYAARSDAAAAQRCIQRAEAPALFAAQTALLRGARLEAVALIRKSAVPKGPLGLRHRLLKAELLLSEKAATEAFAAAKKAGDVDGMEHARWLSLTLAPIHVTPQPPRVPLLALSTPVAVAGGRDRAFNGLMATWRNWLSGRGGRLAARYQLFRHRGHAPAYLEAYLFAASKLLADGESLDPWLDALAADDARAVSLRRYALSRWRVAMWRKDGASAKAWRTRLDWLLERAAQPNTAELFQTMRL